MRLTTVAQAMAALSLPEDDELRWQMGRALEAEWQKPVLAPDHERFSRGLGFNFHTITLATGAVFNVP